MASDITYETKLDYVNRMLDGKISIRTAAKELDVSIPTVCRWKRTFVLFGADGLVPNAFRTTYPNELKRTIVTEFLNEGMSIEQLCVKYNIRSTITIRNWIKQYQRNKDRFTPNYKQRRLTVSEIRKLTEYCINHNMNYGDTAEHYSLDYNSVYGYVNRYLNQNR